MQLTFPPQIPISQPLFDGQPGPSFDNAPIVVADSLVPVPLFLPTSLLQRHLLDFFSFLWAVCGFDYHFLSFQPLSASSSVFVFPRYLRHTSSQVLIASSPPFSPLFFSSPCRSGFRRTKFFFLSIFCPKARASFHPRSALVVAPVVVTRPQNPVSFRID